MLGTKNPLFVKLLVTSAMSSVKQALRCKTILKAEWANHKIKGLSGDSEGFTLLKFGSLKL